jgi:hypothetical protein
MRCTAATRSSGVKNQAFAGESGKKNLIVRRVYVNMPKVERDDKRKFLTRIGLK